MKTFQIHKRITRTLIYSVEAENETDALQQVNAGLIPIDVEIEGKAEWLCTMEREP